ncbi:MAG: peptidoglycan-binding protein [Leptolyngbyaceae cyanobacterium bins.59]|nr:peptidoglycan-binding protein [Leptolyngbyaceae cyanobacterium bins.59]
MAALKRGSRGGKVTALQTRLKEQGFFQGSVTGVYGPVTERAVRRFQARQGLRVDGIAGSQTLAALELHPAKIRPRARGQASPRTAELQRLLASRGFDPGPVDGVYGARTRAAIRQAQSQYGLVVDGIAGPATLAALQRGAMVRSEATSSGQTVGTRTDIKELQQLLTAQGFYGGPVDGVYGSQTRSAVRAVQQAYGLVVDGIPGPATWAVLRRSSRSDTGTTNQETAALQKLLTERGFYSGPINGVDNSSTRAAIRAAQQAYGLRIDGLPSPTTRQGIRRVRPASVPRSRVLPVPLPPSRRQPDASTRSNRSGQEQPISSTGALSLQKLLSERGFYSGSLDGVYGLQTRAALISAQEFYGVTADGVANQRIIDALLRG